MQSGLTSTPYGLTSPQSGLTSPQSHLSSTQSHLTSPHSVPPPTPTSTHTHSRTHARTHTHLPPCCQPRRIWGGWQAAWQPQSGQWPPGAGSSPRPWHAPPGSAAASRPPAPPGPAAQLTHLTPGSAQHTWQLAQHNTADSFVQHNTTHLTALLSTTQHTWQLAQHNTTHLTALLSTKHLTALLSTTHLTALLSTTHLTACSAHKGITWLLGHGVVICWVDECGKRSVWLSLWLPFGCVDLFGGEVGAGGTSLWSPYGCGRPVTVVTLWLW